MRLAHKYPGYQTHIDVSFLSLSNFLSDFWSKDLSPTVSMNCALMMSRRLSLNLQWQDSINSFQECAQFHLEQEQDGYRVKVLLFMNEAPPQEVILIDVLIKQLKLDLLARELRQNDLHHRKHKTKLSLIFKSIKIQLLDFTLNKGTPHRVRSRRDWGSLWWCGYDKWYQPRGSWRRGHSFPSPCPPWSCPSLSGSGPPPHGCAALPVGRTRTGNATVVSECKAVIWL